MEGSALTCCGWNGTWPQPLGWLAWRKETLTARTHPPHRPPPPHMKAQNALRVRGLNRGWTTPDLYLCWNVALFLRFVPWWLWFCIWMCLNAPCFQLHIWSAYVLRALPHAGQYGVSNVYIPNAHCWDFCVLAFLYQQTCLSLSHQLFVIVVWNFELYMIPLALLLPLAWNYILIASGKDTRQDVVSNPAASRYPSAFLSFHCKTLFPYTMQGKNSKTIVLWQHVYHDVLFMASITFAYMSLLWHCTSYKQYI